jgi:ATP-dependent exoDNAse (exonuclease V) beta subunit
VELVLVPGQDGQDESISAEDGRIFEAQFLAERILELEGKGFPVWDKKEQAYRPFRFGDAAILFRATTSLFLYEEAFKQAGLPYLTVSGRGYYDRPEVQDLISLLAGLQDPGDELSLAAALRSPLFNLSDDTLYRLRWHTPSGQLAEKPVRFRQALSDPPPTDQPDQVAFAAEVLDDLWQKTGRVEVWRLLRSALDRTGFEAALALDGASPNSASRQLGNVGKFLQLARQRGGASLSDFLRRLNDLRAREAREGEALGSAPDSGAVQLMSIHAAKGLEFPVVAVADLGRSQRGAFGSPRILHDPAFGIVCKQRDRDGDWHKPASYRWGEWLDERMEAAEDKRLLYVACTRAADLLILSGKVSRGTSWLNDILEIWGVQQDGPAEGVLAIGGFSLRVLRPQYQLIEAIPGPRQFRQSAGLDKVPPLARPLPAVSRPQAMAVTGYARAQSADDDIPSLRPIFKPDGSAGKKTFVPGYIIGDIVHRALADWEPLALPNPQLRERFAAYARREGLTGDGAVQFAVARAMRMLANLRRSDLYEQIDHAARRLTEVPFSLSSEAGDFHGVIDMLYQDGRGGWHLIDWKTEWVSGEKLEEQAHRHFAQLSVYFQAIKRSLACSPQVSICFLHPDFCHYPFSEDQIEAISSTLEPLLP